MKDFNPELRYDLISGDWVIISKKRKKRPEISIKKKCPFCNLNLKKEKVLLAFYKNKEISKKELKNANFEWTSIVIENKYPAFLPTKKIITKKEGKFYKRISAYGFHELVITKDHKLNFPDFSIYQIKEILDCYQKRFQFLSKQKHIKYIAIFSNYKREAGASIAHPHSQIVAIPLIDTDLKRAIEKSGRYWRKNKKCIYCQLNNWEKRAKKRIIFENNDFLAVCPFASKIAFQVIISPKFHSPSFASITDSQKLKLAEAFKYILLKYRKVLNDPPYNFYLHSAPLPSKNYPFYHWHWTFLPKTSIWAGFEVSTHMEVSSVAPEEAAKILRDKKI